MKEDKEHFSFEEKVVADEVADEILTVTDDKDDRRHFLLILLFLICLIFLVSSLSFAIFDTYYNGGKNNIVDVGVDIIIDDNGSDKDDNKGDKDNNKVDKPDNKGNKNSNSGENKGNGLNNENSNDKPSKPVTPVTPSDGSVLFSFNEGSNYINMTDVYPMEDNLGKNLTGNNHYFDFNVSACINDKNKGNLVYELALVPTPGNTVDDKDLRIYLTENGSDVSILKNAVNNYSDLPDSNYHKGGKVIYRKVVTDKFYGDYVFRMWLSSKAKVAPVSEKFGCKLTVDAYYE